MPSAESPHDTPLVVFKLGGSLLSQPGLAVRVESVLAQRSGSRPLLLVGGGAATDVVRDWAQLHELNEETAHRLALEAMALNALLVTKLLAGSNLVTSLPMAEEAWSNRRLPVLQASHFLAAAEAETTERLPHNWDAASDSIAAWIAAKLSAAELVLMKSIDRPAQSPVEAAVGGAVDPHFPLPAAGVRRISWVNLRSASPAIETWHDGPADDFRKSG